MEQNEDINKQEDIDYYTRKQESMKLLNETLNNSNISVAERKNLETHIKTIFDKFFSTELEQKKNHISLLMKDCNRLNEEVKKLTKSLQKYKNFYIEYSTIKNSKNHSFDDSNDLIPLFQDLGIKQGGMNILRTDKDEIIRKLKTEVEAMKKHDLELILEYENEIAALKKENDMLKSKKLVLENEGFEILDQNDEDNLNPIFVEENSINRALSSKFQDNKPLLKSEVELSGFEEEKIEKFEKQSVLSEVKEKAEILTQNSFIRDFDRERQEEYKNNYDIISAEMIEKEICIEKLENVISEKEETIKSMKDLIEDKNKMISKLENDFAILDQQIKKQKNELEESLAKNIKLEESLVKNIKLEESLANIEVDLKNYVREINIVTEQNERLELQVMSNDKLLNSNKQEISRLNDENRKLREQTTSKEELLNSKEREIINLTKKNMSFDEKTKLTHELLSLKEKDISDLTKKNKSLEEQIKSKVFLINSKEKELNSILEQQKKYYEEQLLKKNKELNETSAKLKQADELHSNDKEKIDKLLNMYNKNKDDLEDKINKLKQEYSNLEKCLKENDEKYKALEGEKNQLTNDLNNKNDEVHNINLALGNESYERNNDFKAFKQVYWNFKELIQELKGIIQGFSIERID